MPKGIHKEYIPSDSIQRSIAAWEGAAMDGPSIDPLSGKLVKKNNSFEKEAKLFYNAIPDNLRDKILGNQSLADNLFSYSYNVGSGNFKRRVVPALEHYFSNPLVRAKEVTDSMYAVGDSILPGLALRRETEKEGVYRNLPERIKPQPTDNTEQPDALRTNRPKVIPPTVGRDTKKAMQDKVDFHNFMDSISIQKNLPPAYTPSSNIHSEGGYIEHPDWNSLPMSERAAMIRVAVGNGTTNLQDIRDRYNEFAWGGPSEAAKKRIERWEGKAMTGAKDPLSGKYARNSSFEDEAKRFYSVIPKNIREQVLSNPELADNLYSYSYNVGAGNFKKKVVPALQRYYAGKGSVEDIQRSMWASGDTKLRGLQRRRAEERAGVGRALLGSDMPIPTFYTETATTGNEGFIPFKPMIPDVFGAEQSIEAPVTIEDIPPTIQKPEEPVYSPEEIERQERAESLANLSRIFSLMNGTSENSSMLGALNLLTGNYANGGKIHIKPSHRGRLTELKERTGKTEAELYNDGNPAHKKMVVFARNSRKWKHGLGGYLYPDGGYVREVNNHPIAFDAERNLVDQVTGEKGYMPLPEVSVTANPDDVARGRAQRWYRDFGIESNDATSVADGRRQNSHLDERGIEGAAKAAAWAKAHPILNNVGLGLSTIPLGVAAAPAVVGGGELAATALANPYVDAALTSMGGAHAAQSLANGEANWLTALELVPLGRLAKPLYEGVVQPGMRLLNYPLTPYRLTIGNTTNIASNAKYLKGKDIYGNEYELPARTMRGGVTDINGNIISDEELVNNWKRSQDFYKMRLRNRGLTQQGHVYVVNKKDAYNIAKTYEPYATEADILKDLEDLGGGYALPNGADGYGIVTKELNTMNKQRRGTTNSSKVHEDSHLMRSEEDIQNLDDIGWSDLNLDKDEAAARGTQIKSMLGIKDGTPITANQLKYMQDNMVRLTGFDNNMQAFLNSITDFDRAARWLSENSFSLGGTLNLLGGLKHPSGKKGL